LDAFPNGKLHNL